MPRRLLALLFAGMVLSISGCAPANPEFAAIRGDLDEDGELFELSRTGESRARLQQRWQDLARTLARSDDENTADSAVQKGLLRLDFFRSLCGIDEIIATGASSRRIAPGWYRNRYVWLSDPAAPGLIWNIFPDPAPDALALFGQLPGSTQAALQLSLNLSNLYGTGPYQALLPDWLRESFAAEDAPVWLDKISGVWQLAWLGGGQVLITLPDPQGKLWEYLLRIHEAADSPTPPKTLEFADNCYLLPGDQRLMLFCGFANAAEVQKVQSAAAPARLADQPDFRELAQAFSGDSCGYFFQRGDTRIWGITRNFTQLDTALPGAEMADLRRGENRLNLTLISPRTWQQIKNDLLWDATLKFFDTFDPELEIFHSLLAPESEEDDAGSDTPEPPQDNQANSTLGSSRKLLEQYSAALQAYCRREGHFPASLGEAGIAELISAGDLPNTAQKPENIRYLYLGDWGKLASPQLPLVIEDPRSLKNRTGFLVLDSDGSISEIELEKPDLLRQISILHTQRNFSEAQFKELRRRITILENLF